MVLCMGAVLRLVCGVVYGTCVKAGVWCCVWELC